MKTITLPADIELLYLDDIAHLIADCINPQGSKDPDGKRYKAALQALTPELEQAAISGALRTRHPETLGVISPAVESADLLGKRLNVSYTVPMKYRVVTVPDFAAYVADRGVAVVMEAPEQTPQPQANAIDTPIDYTMLATRQRLIDAFGSFTGMDDSWFTNLKDTPKLKDARKVAGSGGKDSTEPLFCPFEVMRWLTDSKQKKGKGLSPDKGWHLLQGHFPKVYNQYSIGDTRTD